MNTLRPDENQRSLAMNFGTELAEVGVRYRNAGLSDLTRTGVLLGAAIALLDMEFHQQAGRTLNEEEFLELARLTYLEIRMKGKGQAS